MAPNDTQLTLALGLAGLHPSDSTNSSVESLALVEAPKKIPPTFKIPELPSKARTIPPPQGKPIRIPSRKPAKTRLGLPITLHAPDTLATVLACADTGADVNIISNDLAFALANGKIVEAFFQINALCSFGIETEVSFSMQCAFYVLHKVATPIIMGMGFLAETKTMTEHRERLVRVPRPAFQALSVRSINKPQTLLACQLDRLGTLATADSGAEIDLMSSSFASERGFIVHDGEEKIEMADGSIAITSGVVQVQLAITDINQLKSKVASVDFFLLDNLVHDLIVGEDSLEELEVFTTNRHALVDAPIKYGPLGLNRIRHLGAIDRITKWIKNKILGKSSDDDDQVGDTPSCVSNLQEIDRREREAARIAALPLDEQEAAIQQEVQRQKDYNTNLPFPSRDIAAGSPPRTNLPYLLDLSSRLLPPPNPILPLVGTFKCDFPNCDAAPFQTQYLLNSHANIHSQSRPHFCPVANCPRGEGGRGFKRKNEMIRHGIVHRSPGYVCPFCPDREHKYPRPDNLQRHVRVHHVDMNEDDARLQEVLAQRPEGGSRGRRRFER
ncbi:hypothetical protein IQ07DRAFT_76971 [Pyrenochaeta sp. DS3sAY3a]|nr:hypothetical protein IQ07DRAFT_76971 [Pyrenochaeta sp. DS3sAY3a]